MVSAPNEQVAPAIVPDFKDPSQCSQSNTTCEVVKLGNSSGDLGTKVKQSSLFPHIREYCKRNYDISQMSLVASISDGSRCLDE